MRQRYLFLSVLPAVFFLFSCDGGLTVPYVSLTVQSTTVSDEELEKLNETEGVLFCYAVPASVSVADKEAPSGRISIRQKRNYRFQISCQPRSFLSFDRWTAEPSANAEIVNPDSMTTQVKLTGDCTITAAFKRHHFLVNYTAGNAVAEPTGVNDEQVNALYRSLLEMKNHGLDPADYPYPAFNDKGVLVVNPDYPDYQSVLDFMKGLDKNSDGRIHSFSDALTADELNRFFFGSYDENAGIYRGLYAGILFFGDCISSLPEGKSMAFRARPQSGAAGTFTALGWEASAALTAVSGGGPGDTETIYQATGDGVSVYRVVCEAVTVEVNAVRVSADAVLAAEENGRVFLKTGTVTEPALSSVTASGSDRVTVAENEKITATVTVDGTETFAGWLYEDDIMMLSYSGETAEWMPLFTDYLYQSNQRTVTAVFILK